MKTRRRIFLVALVLATGCSIFDSPPGTIIIHSNQLNRVRGSQ